MLSVNENIVLGTLTLFMDWKLFPVFCLLIQANYSTSMCSVPSSVKWGNNSSVVAIV